MKRLLNFNFSLWMQKINFGDFSFHCLLAEMTISVIAYCWQLKLSPFQVELTYFKVQMNYLFFCQNQDYLKFVWEQKRKLFHISEFSKESKFVIPTKLMNCYFMNNRFLVSKSKNLFDQVFSSFCRFIKTVF